MFHDSIKNINASGHSIEEITTWFYKNMSMSSMLYSHILKYFKMCICVCMHVCVHACRLCACHMAHSEVIFNCEELVLLLHRFSWCCTQVFKLRGKCHYPLRHLASPGEFLNAITI